MKKRSEVFFCFFVFSSPAPFQEFPSEWFGREGQDEAKVKFTPERLKRSDLVLLGRMNKIEGTWALSLAWNVGSKHGRHSDNQEIVWLVNWLIREHGMGAVGRDLVM